MLWTLAAVFFVFFGLAVPPAGAQQDAQCLTCHSVKTLQDTAGHSVYVDAAKEKVSVHGSLSCTSCHTDIKGYPHPAHPARVDCSTCHTSEAGDVAASVHAKASAQPCLSCHGDPHAIVPVKDPQSPVFAFNIPRTCGSCHGNPQVAKKFGLTNVYSLYIDSIHGFALTKDGLLVAASCSSCHGTHRILSHTNPQSRTYRTNIPATCGSCHGGPETAYLAGIHGKEMEAGNSKAPVCSDCHTAHQITQVHNVSWQMQESATCGSCHRERFASYLDTFHAQISALGYVQTARCWNCHNDHDILPASDPKSTVAPGNRVATCSQCHAGATISFVRYRPHADPRTRASFPALYYVRWFMILLMLGVFGFFGLHTILWLVRSLFDRPSGGTRAGNSG
jgi:Doubled CXXCH motif (Paired_CXXCH_1)